MPLGPTEKLAAPAPKAEAPEVDKPAFKLGDRVRICIPSTFDPNHEKALIGTVVRLPFPQPDPKLDPAGYSRRGMKPGRLDDNFYMVQVGGETMGRPQRLKLRPVPGEHLVLA